jgi:uncharacterized protein DUF5666
MRPSSIVGRCATFGAALFALAACHGSASNTADTVSASGALAPPAPSPDSASAASAAPATVRGAVTAVSATSLQVATPNGTDTVALTPPVQVFDRESSSLANVKQNTFIGVTTVKQPDGSERATEIHIFPEALRGLGEGSRMMTQPSGAASGSRMTNGSVNASPSRMSNGSVSSTNGSTLVVQYAGGSTTVTVPPNTPVMEIKLVSRPLAVGDSVVVLTSKSSDGKVTSNRVMLMSKR